MLLEKQIEKLQKKVRSEESGYPLMFSALGDNGRFAIFKLLTEHKDLCVTDISRILNVCVTRTNGPNDLLLYKKRPSNCSCVIKNVQIVARIKNSV